MRPDTYMISASILVLAAAIAWRSIPAANAEGPAPSTAVCESLITLSGTSGKGRAEVGQNWIQTQLDSGRRHLLVVNQDVGVFCAW